MGFHGCVASPSGCAGSGSHGMVMPADRSGVVETLPLLLKNTTRIIMNWEVIKEKRAETRSLHATNIHLFFAFVKRESTKIVDFSRKKRFELISPNSYLTRGKRLRRPARATASAG